MKIKLNKSFVVFFSLSSLFSVALFAGNTDRAGQAGATELLIDPWARNTGMAGANSASITGLESTFLNVAGTAFIPKTELVFSHQDYLQGTGIAINSFGFCQHVGETGVVSLTVMSMNFGQIPITTVQQPDGGLGTYSPQFSNIGFSYAKKFSDQIYGGMTLRVISETVTNVSAQGVAIDGGIQYVTGRRKQIHFGIALKNVGPQMKFSGDGLSFTTPLPQLPQNSNPNGTVVTYTVEERSQAFELPSLMNIGASYDFYFTKDTATYKNNRLSVCGNFTSNSYTKDQFILGLEWGFRSILMVRVGYCYEQGITSASTSTTVYTGPAAGVSFDIPLRNKSTFCLDYSYRPTDPFQGVHALGVRVNL